MDYADYPITVVQDIVRLRRRIQAPGLPPKQVDGNLLIGTWNIKRFGEVYEHWEENPGQAAYRISDHFPLWREFIVDGSVEAMALTLGADPAAPDPLSVVPD